MNRVYKFDLHRDFPSLNYWIANADVGAWNDRFPENGASNFGLGSPTRLFATFESSLGLRCVDQFLKDSSRLKFIDFATNVLETYDSINAKFARDGMVIAETGKVYRTTNMEELREDYLIASLSGIRQ